MARLSTELPSILPNPALNPDRFAQLEAAVAVIQKTLDVKFKRMAMQAELDLPRSEIDPASVACEI
jgi:hypothetical protein